MTELEKFRTALGFTREKLAAEVHGSAQNIARYEAEMPFEFRLKLAKVAEKEGRSDLAALIVSGNVDADNQGDLAGALEDVLRAWRLRQPNVLKGARLSTKDNPDGQKPQLQGKQNYDYVYITSDIERDLITRAKVVAASGNADGIRTVQIALRFAESLIPKGDHLDSTHARSDKSESG